MFVMWVIAQNHSRSIKLQPVLIWLHIMTWLEEKKKVIKCSRSLDNSCCKAGMKMGHEIWRKEGCMKGEIAKQ